MRDVAAVVTVNETGDANDVFGSERIWHSAPCGNNDLPDMMGVVGRLGRVLGPKGLMPNPKAGTVTMDVTKAVNDIKAGKIEYRLDKTNIIHVPLGKASFTDEQLSDNFQSLMGAINKAKPASLKGQYIKSATLASTMGPGVKLNVVKITQ